MVKTSHKFQVIESSFQSLRFALYHFVAWGMLIILLIVVFVVVNYGYIALVPCFLKPIMIEHQWLLFLYIPILGICMIMGILYIWYRYSWFCRNATYRIEEGKLSIINGKKIYSISLDKVNHAQLKTLEFHMLNGRYMSSDTRYKIFRLTIDTDDNKYHFYSTPFRKYEYTKPEDFRCFVKSLRKVGLLINDEFSSVK